MNEIEVKAKIDDFNEVSKKLTELGCTFSEKIVQKDTIFFYKSMTPNDVKEGDVVLRIRDANGKKIFTLKKELDNELSCLEEELEIMDAETMTRIIQILDFNTIVHVNKVRIKTNYNDLEICLDEVEGLGTYIEVEKQTENSNTDEVQEELFQFLESLGVKRENRVFRSYDTMIFNLKK